MRPQFSYGFPMVFLWFLRWSIGLLRLIIQIKELLAAEWNTDCPVTTGSYLKGWGHPGSQGGNQIAAEGLLRDALDWCFNPQTDTQFRMIWEFKGCWYPLAMENAPFQCPYHAIGLRPGDAKVCPSSRKSWRVSPTSWLVPRTRPGRASVVSRLNPLWSVYMYAYDHIRIIYTECILVTGICIYIYIYT